MRTILICCLILFAAFHGIAQNASLKGKITDTLEKKELQYAVVALLHSSDSTLYRYLRTNIRGEFHFNKLDSGKYFLLISYPRFADYGDQVEIGTSEVDLGHIPLIQKSALLEAVIIRQQWSIRMKGDTIEYKADSFKVAEGATVKDLLRQLPGLQVDRNGQITAQGQKVERVLVDGEEFFSDDPAVVIENLRADAVDKVQSYDKKSDQAEFTGVDDGSRSKTLNLVLKDDKKKGWLGKVVVGGGTEQRYSGEAMLNYFKGKKKASVYGIGSNTGRMGLNWEDRSKFGGGDNLEDADVEMGAGYIMINTDSDEDFSDWENNYNGEGIPRTFKAGGHYSNKWNEEKQRINGNYSFRDTRNLAKGNSLYKYLLPDTAYYLQEQHTSSSWSRQQMFNGMYDLKFDSLSSVRIKLNGKLERSENNTVIHSETDDENQDPVNRNIRQNLSGSNGKAFLASVLWRQKFRKKGRTMSLSASQKQVENTSEGYLKSRTEFLDPFGTVSRLDTIDQFKDNFSRKISTNSKLVYTEPLGKKGLIEFNYAFQRVASTLDRKTFEELGGKYNQLNNLFSVRYGLVYLSNSGGIKYQYNGKKVTANIGTNLGFADYKQKDSTGRQIRHFTYTNLFPTSRITYRFTSQRTLNLNYSGTPQPPGIEQIQPTRENSNPLFITTGNQNLEQAFRHNISLFFTDFKMLTGRNIWINGSFHTTDNAIVTSQVIDSGITKQQYVNAGGNYGYWFYGSYGFKIKKIDTYLGFNLNYNGNNYVNFIDGIKNTNRSNSTGMGIHLNKWKENKFHISAGGNFNYNTNRTSTKSTRQKTSFWSQNYNLNGNYSLSKKIAIGTDINWELREKTDAFTGNNNFTIWNLELDYKLFKKNNGIIRFAVNDVLKQRRGFERQFSSNYLFEKNYNTLGRYAMLSFIWNFNKTPASK